jgi:hypothetical protein
MVMAAASRAKGQKSRRRGATKCVPAPAGNSLQSLVWPCCDRGAARGAGIAMLSRNGPGWVAGTSLPSTVGARNR